VDEQLRTAIATARSGFLRCLKAVIITTIDSESGERKRKLTFASSLEEDAASGETIEKEFEKCIFSLVQDAKPCLLLFRCDHFENIDGSRWLLIAWVPGDLDEAERALYLRSRNVLADLVTQQYFLTEILADDRKKLTWSTARAAMARQATFQDEKVPPRLRSDTSRAAEAKLPLIPSPTALGLIQRLVNQEDSCLRLLISNVHALNSNNNQSSAPVPELEAKVVDAQTPGKLSKENLPSSACYFALYVPRGHDLLFIHWCPERMVTRDSIHRMREDAQYAVLKASVMQQVLAAFPEPKPALLQVDAREAQDLVEAANRAAEAESYREAHAEEIQPYVHRSTAWFTEDQNPIPPSVKYPTKTNADWPNGFPPEAAKNVAMPSSMVFPSRPVPPWRGGSKITQIGSSGPSLSMALSRHKKRQATAKLTSSASLAGEA